MWYLLKNNAKMVFAWLCIILLCHVFSFFLLLNFLYKLLVIILPHNTIAYNFNLRFVNGKTEMEVSHIGKFSRVQCCIKVNESRHKQCGVTPHFSSAQNPLKKLLRKDTIEKSFLIDLPTTNKAIYSDLLIWKTHSRLKEL